MAILYGSETVSEENKMAGLKRTEEAMVRAMYGVQLIEKKKT